ncbi:MAG: KUP/HAK/KT family potassium transporter, partial [Burkholderiaceae bacterium]
AFDKRYERSVTIGDFMIRLAQPDAPERVPGIAIYLTQSKDFIPEALALNLKHNSVVHERVVLLTVTTERVPRVAEEARLSTEELTCGFSRVELKFGFAEKPNVPATLITHAEALDFDATTASYFLGRETPVPSLHPELPGWQERIYAFLAHNAVRAPDYYLIPPAQVVELGTRVEM